MNETAVAAILVLIVVPALLGWALLIRGLWAAFLDRRIVQREARLSRELDAELLAKQIAAHRSAIGRKRELRAFADAVGDSQARAFAEARKQNRAAFDALRATVERTPSGKVRAGPTGVLWLKKPDGGIEFVELGPNGPRAA